MDRFISAYEFEQDKDLNFCDSQGVAYQSDMSKLIEYDSDYFQNYIIRENTPIAKALNIARCDLVERFYRGELLDIGVGSGEFIKSRPNTYGYDINTIAVKWLHENELYRANIDDFHAFSMWDVVEHIANPEEYFSIFPSGSWLFTSIPIFDDLLSIRQSKHYKPGEHLYYFTHDGLVSWMALHGMECRHYDDRETDCGREGIRSFVFRKTS